MSPREAGAVKVPGLTRSETPWFWLKSQVLGALDDILVPGRLGNADLFQDVGKRKGPS